MEPSKIFGAGCLCCSQAFYCHVKVSPLFFSAIFWVRIAGLVASRAPF